MSHTGRARFTLRSNRAAPPAVSVVLHRQGVFTRRDRVELAVLGLWALGWALVVAPALHAVEHGHAHHHGAPADTSQHGDGSLEHHQALLLQQPPPPAVVTSWTLLAQAEPSSPDAPHLAAQFASAQPQGP